MIRQPAVAGRFYPENRETLDKLIRSITPPIEPTLPAFGLVSPHAGYVYSGAIAAETFAAVKLPESFIVLGPNHHGFGHSGAVYASGSWLTPLGEIPIDAELASNILAACPALSCDESAHLHEHSLEVQVPFIQSMSPSSTIVPICLGHLSLDVLLETGEQIGALLNVRESETLIVASNDMTHFESSQRAEKLDHLALEHVLNLDPEGLYQTVRDHRISMCGVIPVVVMLAAVRAMGATHADLIRYGHSGEVSGDSSEVVGYAGVVIR